MTDPKDPVSSKSDRALLMEAVLILRRLESLIEKLAQNPVIKRFL